MTAFLYLLAWVAVAALIYAPFTVWLLLSDAGWALVSVGSLAASAGILLGAAWSLGRAKRRREMAREEEEGKRQAERAAEIAFEAQKARIIKAIEEVVNGPG